MCNNEPTPFRSVQQPCPFTVTLKLYLDASLHVFPPRHVALTRLSLVLLVSQMTRLPMIPCTITDATFLDYVKMNVSLKTQPAYISASGSDSSLGVWSVPPGSSEEPSSWIMVFGSLVLTTESGLFSIACHLIWSNTSSSVGSVPFFQILWIAWIGLLMINSVSRWETFLFYFWHLHLYVGLIRSLWNALLF